MKRRTKIWICVLSVIALTVILTVWKHNHLKPSDFYGFQVGVTTESEVILAVGFPDAHLGSGIIYDVYYTTDGNHVSIHYAQDDRDRMVITSISFLKMDESYLFHDSRNTFEHCRDLLMPLFYSLFYKDIFQR